MSNEERKVPELRFKGFFDDWEQRKLFEISQLTKGKFYSKSDLIDNGNQVILYGQLYTKFQSEISYTESFVKPKPNSIYSKGNEVIIPASGESSKDISIASAITNKNIIIGGDLNIISPINSLNNSFLALKISNGNTKKVLSKYAQGKSIVHLHGNNFKYLPINFPNFPEQIKIKDFINKIEKIISLHQRKINILKKQKQTYLNRIFPKKNENTPSLRFSGSKKEWEQRKLGEVFEQTSNLVNPKLAGIELWSLTVKNGLTPKTARYNRDFLVKKNDKFKAVKNNEFIYNPMNMTLGAIDLNSTGKTVAVSGYYITMISKSNFDSKYFNVWLKTPIAIKNYKIYATGSLIERQRVQFPTLSKIKAYVPLLSEQKKIGNIFMNLEEVITLYQIKINTLQNIKKIYLRKMFL